MANCLICGRKAGLLSDACDACKEKRSPGSSGKPQSRKSLSSVALVREAAFEIYRNRAVLFLAALVPILCSTALRLACTAYVCVADNEASPTAMYALNFARLPFYVMFASICHRIILLDGTDLPRRWGLFWSYRETKFLGWLVVIAVITLAISYPIAEAIFKLPYETLVWLFEWSPFSITFYTCVLASTYIDGRLGLVFPATAVGEKFNLFRSWRYTAGNGGSIFVALMIPILLIRFLDYVIFDLLFDVQSALFGALVGLLYYPLIAIGVGIITIAYRDLVSTRDL